MMYKREGLEVMYRTQLYRMAADLGLNVTKKTKKGELIEKLLEVTVVLKTTVSVEEEPPPMSVRV